MAPAIPVLTRAQMELKYGEQLANPEKFNCQLKSLTQHECTFKTLPLEDTLNDEVVPEIICLPFKRVFQRCLIKEMAKVDGKKQVVEKWVNIEITDADTNKDLLQETKYSDVVHDFLSVNQDFKKWLHSEL